MADTLSDYDIHAEAKFRNGDGLNSGELQRRRVEVRRVLHIGKESHEWQENEALGLKAEAEIQFGEALPSPEMMQAAIRKALLDGRTTSNILSKSAGVSKTSVSAVRNASEVVNQTSLANMFSVIFRTC